MRVEIEEVRKFYLVAGGAGLVTALDGIDLTVESGEFCLLQGPSGSGKTTLLAVIAGLARPSAGKVLLDGKSGGLPRGVVASAFQEPFFVPELTVLENLLLPTLRRRGALPAERGEHLLEEFGLAGMFDLFPAALSGGEKRRLDLARALVCPSRMLLLDEPTAYLDEVWSSRVMELVMKRVGDRGTTLLVATHNPLPGAEAARVVRMERGKVIEDGDRYH